MVKISTAVIVVLAATIAGAKARIEIDELRNRAVREVSARRTELQDYARMRLTGSSGASTRSQEHCVMHMARQYAVAVSALRFRAVERLILAAVNIISTRFDIRNREAMRESFRRRGEPVENYVAMIFRAWVRGMAEGVRLTRVMMSLLLLTLRDNPSIKNDSRFTLNYNLQNETIDAWQFEMDDLNYRFLRFIKSSTEKSKVPSDIIDKVDEELDGALSFHRREGRVYEPELYNTYAAMPMKFAVFFIDHQMEELVGFNMTRCEGVRDFEHAEVDAVVQEQIDALRNKLPLRIW